MYTVEPDVKAMITSLRKKPIGNGYRPAHLIGDYLTTGSQQFIGKEILYYGESVEGMITFLSPEAYPHSLEVGMKLIFQEGSRVTGYVEILEIYNKLLEKNGV